MRTRALFFVAAIGLTAVSRASAADPTCNSLPDEPGTPITKLYIESGDTQEPMIRALGKLLIKSSTKPLRVIYRNRPTCQIRKDMFTGEKMTDVMDGATPRPVQYIQLDTTKDPAVCTVPAKGTSDALDPIQPIQLGIGATYLSSCPEPLPLPDDLGVFEGPLQAYGFIAHKNSTQNAITAAEGYLAFGFVNGGGEATPWVTQELRFLRAATASTTLTMAAAIRVPAAKMQGTLPMPKDTSLNIIAEVKKDTNPEAQIGVLGMDLFDQNRDVVKLLPFKSWGQRFAYYPDKTKDAFDKQNVRDGHYLPWAPTPYMSKVDAVTKQITDVNAKRFYELVRGFVRESDVDGIKVIAQTGLIPECAMKVKRAGDGLDLETYSDPAPCGCFFEKNVKIPAGSACVACTDDGPCGTGKCRYGYCEAK